MQFQAVIFDMDGLLLDSERIALAAFLETCAYFSIGDQTELFLRCIGTNQALGEQVLKEGLRGKADHLNFGRIWDDKYIDRTSSNPIPLKVGAAELLLRLRLLNVPAAVATSTGTVTAIQNLQDTGILHNFNVVVGGDQVETSKPHPAIYLKVAGILGVEPQNCLALEDSEKGVQSAVSAGMTVIQIPDLVPPSLALSALGHIILGSLNDVVNWAFPHERPADLGSSGR